jgi:hypothetical protein
MGALLTASAFGFSGRTLEPIHFLHLPHKTEKQFSVFYPPEKEEC